MGTSIQVVRGKAESFNDIDLLVLLRFMVEEIGAGPSEYPSLAPFVSIWTDCCSDSGPGTIDLQLDRLDLDERSASEFARLLNAVERAWAAWGALIPAHVLNTKYFVRGVRFNDYEISRLTAATDKLRKLVGGPTSTP